MKDLFAYGSIKNRRVCKNISLKSNFKKTTKSKDGLQSQWEFGVNVYNKNYFNKKRALL